MDGHGSLVIVPTLDEANTIGLLLPAIAEHLPDAVVLVAEVPIIFVDRTHGQSKISRREIYHGALTLLRLRLWRRR